MGFSALKARVRGSRAKTPSLAVQGATKTHGEKRAASGEPPGFVRRLSGVAVRYRFDGRSSAKRLLPAKMCRWFLAVCSADEQEVFRSSPDGAARASWVYGAKSVAVR
jgi:hypothetical protein